MSDFGNLTEFDNFPKDLFLNNAIEEMADEGLLGELDCKGDLKPVLICDVDDDAFGTPLKDGEDEDTNLSKGQCNPFSEFMDEATSEPLAFMDMAPKLDPSKVSDALGMQSLGLSSTIEHDHLSGSLKQGVLSSHPALLAASKLNCMSLDELDLTLVNDKDALCVMSPRSSLQAASSITLGNRAEPGSSVASLSPFGNLSMSAELLRREALCLCSEEMAAPATLQINSPVTSPSSRTGLSNSDGGALINLMLRGEDASSMHSVKGSLPPMSGVMGVEDIRRTFSVPDVMQSHSPSIQRSQSSHALGQLRISGGWVGSCNEDFNALPSCKQEVSPSSNASTVSIYSPYQAASTQELSGSTPVNGPIRRVYSTGDLQAFHGVKSFYGGNPDNFIAEEAADVKIGHYTKEERKMKLRRYRQKRTERNFSKKIKYACRKTLADSRPRVRGRFARTDDMADSSFRGSDLPLIDEYEEVTSHHSARIISDQQTYLMANGSCMVSSNCIPQFWNTVGMKVAM